MPGDRERSPRPQEAHRGPLRPPVNGDTFTADPVRSSIMLQVGFGTADITPSPGMEMPGSFAKHVGKGVHDNCWAVACVIHDGTTPVALVGTDTLIIARETVEAAR